MLGCPAAAVQPLSRHGREAGLPRQRGLASSRESSRALFARRSSASHSGSSELRRCSRLRAAARTVAGVYGIDLGTTNSALAEVVDGAAPVSRDSTLPP